MAESRLQQPLPSSKVSSFLRYLLAVFCAGFALLSLAYGGLKAIRLDISPLFMATLAFFAAAAALSIALFKRLQKASLWQVCVVLFTLAALTRFLFGLLAECAPVSDFANYLGMASAIRSGDRAAVAALVEHYQLPEFAGLAVLNAALSYVFSPTVSGLQMANVVITGLIAVMIFVLGSQFQRRCGLLAGLLYVWYPSNILSAQLLTNQHAATLFTLLSAWAMLRSVQTPKWLPALLSSLAAAALLVIAHFFHPSSLATRIAFICFLAVLILHVWKRRNMLLRLVCILLCFFVCFQSLFAACLAGLRWAALLPAQGAGSTMLSKIVVGLNPETYGAYSLEDYTQISALPAEDRTDFCKEIILARISNPQALAKTLAMKTFNMWVRTDNLFILYDAGVRQGRDADTTRAETALEIARHFQLFDALFLALIFLGAFIGLAFQKQISHDLGMTLFLWLALGWLATHIFSEVQPRYRYYAMPYFMLFSSTGWIWLQDRWHSRKSGKNASLPQ